MEKLAIYGFGRFGREIASIIKRINDISPKWEIVGFFDDGITSGAANRYGKVLGGMDELNNWPSQLNVIMVIALADILQKLIEKIKKLNIYFSEYHCTNGFIF